MRKQGYKRYAKTLYKPERPDFEKKLITDFTKGLLPHFFMYAKDKDAHQVSEISDSIVNKLESIIPNPRINCRKIGLDKIDYRILMSNPDIEFDVAFTDRGKIIKEKTDPMIVKYCEMNKKYQFALNDAVNGFSPEDSSKSRMRRNMKYQNISREIVAELSSYGYSDVEIADVLVKFLYGIKNGKNKMALWLCYGDIVYENISRNIKRKTKEIQCVDCGKWFEVSIFDSATKRCNECHDERDKELNRIASRERMRRYRERKKHGVTPTL